MPMPSSANRAPGALAFWTGFGGVALEFDQAQEFHENLLAVLHVPILPPVRVFLRPVWSRMTKEGAFRLGCHFVS